MYNPEKDFGRIVLDILGKDGKSISAVTSELEAKGLKIHRLIITGYLRALTDQGILKEREVPPSKIYVPVKQIPESIYESVGRVCRKISADPDELILYSLYRLLKRPIFTNELKSAGVNRPIGKEAQQHEIQESVKLLRRAGNTVSSQQTAVYPVKNFQDKYDEVLAELTLDIKDSKHLALETKQTTLDI